MSALLRASKAVRVMRAHPGAYARYHRGDPGIFDSIWKGIKGAVGGFVTGGPLGAVAGGVLGLASKSAPKPAVNLAGTFTPLSPADINVGIGGPNVFPGAGGMPPMLGPGRGNQTQSGAGGTDWNDRPNSLQTACPRGYHPNKSGYYTQKQGWIPAGSVCVKNRKRNPLNPRAASRAMARLSSAKHASRFLSRFSIKSGGCGCR